MSLVVCAGMVLLVAAEVTVRAPATIVTSETIHHSETITMTEKQGFHRTDGVITELPKGLQQHIQ